MPYDDSDVKKMLNIMSQNRLDFPRKRVVCYEVKILLHSILYYYFRDRATLMKIRNSPWMQGQCTMPHEEATNESSSTTLAPQGTECEEPTKKTPVPPGQKEQEETNKPQCP